MLIAFIIKQIMNVDKKLVEKFDLKLYKMYSVSEFLDELFDKINISNYFFFKKRCSSLLKQQCSYETIKTRTQSIEILFCSYLHDIEQFVIYNKNIDVKYIIANPNNDCINPNYYYYNKSFYDIVHEQHKKFNNKMRIMKNNDKKTVKVSETFKNISFSIEK
jgi:hypothetical protein